MIDFTKKYKWWVVFGTLSILGDYLLGGLFYFLIFSYVLIIKFLLSDYLKPKTKKVIATTIWIILISYGILTFYANHYFPHGPMYNTGDIVCLNDDRGPCKEKYEEDMRYLNVPDWVKFSRAYGVGILMLLSFAGIVVGTKREGGL